MCVYFFDSHLEGKKLLKTERGENPRSVFNNCYLPQKLRMQATINYVYLLDSNSFIDSWYCLIIFVRGIVILEEV